ncbi:CDP-alcohol phosphatidyltransferase family protein [Ignavibacteria bacterium]|jgi:CDP-diacylglycerol--glycerol-3-phosphate 3-phosphatidyltransferase|nr:CDP-alcohol phosphatidyltransferase family protein [Bacteroidota bacterium]MCZ2133743.1 CDP-alcohol phosphatidyltransferase family protein [Bacteroidota bacterium]
MIWTLSNIISGVRAILAVPMAFFLASGNKAWATVVIVLIVISDVADGYIARRRNEISEFGKIIDPVADKTVTAVGVIFMYLGGYIPAWFFWTVIGRDALILALGAVVTRKTGFTIPSNYAGKAAVVSIAIALTLHFVIADSSLHLPVLILSTVIMAYSLVIYGIRYAQFTQQAMRNL